MRYKGNEMKWNPRRGDRQLLLLHPFGRELPDIRGRQEVHHRFIALLHGEKLRDLHVSTSARSLSRCFPHLCPEHRLLVLSSAAVAEEVFPRVGGGCRPASATAPPAFVVILVSKSFQVCSHWRIPGLQSVESGCQWLHTIHWDVFHAPSFAFQPVAVMFAALIGVPHSLYHRLCL